MCMCSVCEQKRRMTMSSDWDNGSLARYDSRVGHVERDDVVHHLAACVTSGHLDEDEAPARMELAMQAVTQEDLAKLVRGLPSKARLEQLRLSKTRPHRVRNAVL